MCTSFMQNVFAANETNEVYSTKVIKCGSVRGIPAGLPKMCRNAINTIKILVPVSCKTIIDVVSRCRYKSMPRPILKYSFTK